MVVEDDKTINGITFRFSQQLYEKLECISITAWQREQKCFSIPGGGQHIQQLADALEGTG